MCRAPAERTEREVVCLRFLEKSQSSEAQPVSSLYHHLPHRQHPGDLH